MNATATTEPSDSGRGAGAPRTWGWYVLAAYPIVFVLGTAGVLIVFVGTDDPTLYTSGLTAGFIAFGVSALALLTYPAYRADVSRVQEHDGRLPSVRRYAALGLGIPLAVGVLFEIVGLGSGNVNVPGFMALFVAVVVHPVVAFVASLGYLYRRRRLRRREG